MPVYVELVKARGVIAARFKIVDTDTGHSNSAAVRVELRGGGRSEEHGGPASTDAAWTGVSIGTPEASCWKRQFPSLHTIDVAKIRN